MKETRFIMGMPVTVDIVDKSEAKKAIDIVFDYFKYIDEKFSTYKNNSEIAKINNRLIAPENYSPDMQEIFLLCDKTRRETNGYFDIVNNHGKYDPSGMVKGFAIYNASKILKNLGFKNFYVEAGGDVQVFGNNAKNDYWAVGIKNPLNPAEIVKIICLKNNEGIATSGIYERGDHIYNPKNRSEKLAIIISLTIIGKNIYEADRFATAAFAMQKEGINFIEKLQGFEGYMIDKNGIATMTSGFENYIK